MADSRFDIVSKIDHQEVDNALNQRRRGGRTRATTSRAWGIDRGAGDNVVIKANTEERANAVLDVFKTWWSSAGLAEAPRRPRRPGLSGKEYRLEVGLKEGIGQENAKKISKIIRDEGPKAVKAQIQGEELRVTSKSRDDLQAVQSLLKGKETSTSPCSSPTTADDAHPRPLTLDPRPRRRLGAPPPRRAAAHRGRGLRPARPRARGRPARAPTAAGPPRAGTRRPCSRR